MEKNEILYNSFQLILSKETEIENLEATFCEDDEEYRLNFNICDNLCIEPFYENHLKSQTHTIIIRKREQLNK